MISDPKLPFASDSTNVGELKAPEETSSAAGVWFRRLAVLLFVFLCATVGVMLMIVPWRPEWADNPLLTPYPELRDIVASGFVRGLATGLGIINVWIGFWEAIRYREGE
jgi:hypothetical protein